MSTEPTPAVMKYAVGAAIAAALVTLAWTFPPADPEHRAYQPGSGPVDAGQGSSLAAGGERMPRLIVKEVHQAGERTVLSLAAGDTTFWAAVPRLEVQAGDEVHLHGGAPQANFEAKELSRTFASIWLADSAHVARGDDEHGEGLPDAEAGPAAVPGAPEEVLSAEEAGRFTVLRLRRDGAERWVAAPKFDVQPGQQVTVTRELVMKNFHSASLNRTFDEIVFVDEARVVGASEPPPGGLSIAQLYAERDRHKDRQVTLRGRVVKYSPAVMGKNWLHLQDGSSAGPDGNLVVATADGARVGDVVTVTGKVVLDLELSPSHRYAVLLDEARVAP